jgi:hypothetical protein
LPNLGRIAPRDLNACLEIVIASEAKQSILPFFARQDGLLRGACHRPRIRATRWLVMTKRPFENEVGVCAKRSLRSLLETRSSCPDLIRASIHLRKKVVSKKMVHRVKPGDDDFAAPAEREPHLFALYSRSSQPKLHAEATSR